MMTNEEKARAYSYKIKNQYLVLLWLAIAAIIYIAAFGPVG